MKRRCITRTVGAVAGGLLGAAFLPVAVALADDYAIVPGADSTETVTGLYGLDTAPPAIDGSVQGYQTFGVEDTTVDHVLGTFGADESTATDIFGNVNEELLVTSTSGTVGTAAGDVPPVGSVFDYYSFGDSGYANIYSDLASTTPGDDIISDTLVTPFGDINVPVTFDAAAGVPAAFADLLAKDPDAVVDSTAVSGLPPLDVAIQYQLTGLDQTPLGAVDGTFDGDETTTADAFGFSTDELLVTSDGDSAVGDVPPVGSVFNTISFGNGWENDYSAIPSTGGTDTLADTLVTPFGNVDIPVFFDAAAVADANATSIPLAGGDSLVSFGSETFTGVNGVPPLDVALQGTQTFDVDGLAGDQSVGADVSTSSDAFGNIDEAIRVISAPDVADVPQAGSVLDIYTLGDSGFASIYSDLITSTGANVLSDTLVTPFGDITIPLTEALAGFGVESFLPIPF